MLCAYDGKLNFPHANNPQTKNPSKRLVKCCIYFYNIDCVFYISFVFSNARRVLSRCNTRLRLRYLLNKAQEKVIYCINVSLLQQ